MTSFRLKFEEGVRARGVEVTNDSSEPADVLLVLAGTRHLLALREARRRGIRIVQRLDGINWVHRVHWAGARYTLRAVYGNRNLWFIRARLADRVITRRIFWRKQGSS